MTKIQLNEDEVEVGKFGQQEIFTLLGCLSESTHKINTQRALLP